MLFYRQVGAYGGLPPQLSPKNFKPRLVFNTVLRGFKRFPYGKS